MLADALNIIRENEHLSPLLAHIDSALLQLVPLTGAMPVGPTGMVLLAAILLITGRAIRRRQQRAWQEDHGPVVLDDVQREE